MNTPLPHITLLVTTRGRTDTLHQLFSSICEAPYQHITVLLGDQNPPGYLDDLLTSYKRILCIERFMLPPQSLSAARNALLPHVQGDIVALTDDDCQYAPTTLETVRILFQQHANMVALIGNANSILDSITLDTETCYSIFKNAPSWVLFLRTSAIQRIGGFDESMGIGSPGSWQSGEETDYLLRLLQNGGCIRRSRKVVVFHPEPNLTDPALPAKTYAYALGRMHLLRKYKFPLWFKLSNVVFPLLRLPLEGKVAWPYRKAMFLGRLKGLLHMR